MRRDACVDWIANLVLERKLIRRIWRRSIVNALNTYSNKYHRLIMGMARE